MISLNNHQKDQTLAGVPVVKGNDLLFASASEFWRFLAATAFLFSTVSHSLQPFILNNLKEGKVSQIQDFKGAISLANMLSS